MNRPRCGKCGSAALVPEKDFRGVTKEVDCSRCGKRVYREFAVRPAGREDRDGKFGAHDVQARRVSP